MCTNFHSITLQHKMEKVWEVLIGSMEFMRHSHDAIYTNAAKIHRAEGDININREALYALGRGGAGGGEGGGARDGHGLKGILPARTAAWSQQAAAANKNGFFLHNTSGGFSAPAHKAAAADASPSPAKGFGATLGAHGGFSSAGVPREGAVGDMEGAGGAHGSGGASS